MKTDFTKRPVELIIDTGSELGLVASDTVKENKNIQKPIYHLTGIAGQSHRVETDGHLVGNFITDDKTNWLTQIHLIDRRHAGKYDGYVGYDFLKKYGAKVDVHNRVLELHPPNEAETKPKKEMHTENEKSKKVNFIIPNSNPKIGSIKVNNITISTCVTENGECETCTNNKINLPNEWFANETKMIATIETALPIEPSIPTEIHEIPTEWLTNKTKTIATIESTLSTETQNAAELQEIRDKLYFNDLDSIASKLMKIENNRLRLPIHAKQYLNAFPPDNEPIQTRNVASAVILPGMTREQFIMANIPTAHCSPENIEKISNLVHKYPLQFYTEGDQLAISNIIQHKIYLKPGAPIAHTRQFRLSEDMRRDVLRETKSLEGQDIIRRSVSPFNSPAFMVGKKDDMGGKTAQRFVVNYVKVNEYTETRDFPIPRVDQLVDGFSKCKFFSTLDIKSAFHQIELFEPHREITAFTAGFTKYEWNRLPFGLCGGPLTMQEAVTRLLDELLDKGVGVFIDDVAVAAPKISTHDELLDQVFQRLKKHNFQVKISKCHLYTSQFEFLGFIVSDGHIKPNPNKITAILQLSEPKTRKKLRMFLGMVNYYRKFVPNFSKLTKPLNKQTSMKTLYNFDDECREAFNEIKDQLAKDVLLRIPVFDERFYISTDASNTTIGAVLAQGKPPDDKPIQFFSKTLSPTQQRWTAMERECLALVSAVKEFAPYLHGREFTLITDNLALVYINKHNDAYSKLFRMKMDLLSYKYTIVYRPGVQNKVADALTRLDSENEMDLSQFLTKYGEELEIKSIRAITRSGLSTVEKPKGTINVNSFVNCYPGLAGENDEYDRIFSLISITNRELIHKLTGEEEFDQTVGLVNLNDKHLIATLKTNKLDDELKKMTEAIFDHCAEDPEILSIAINTDVRAKQLFILKWLLEKRLQETNIHIALHTNQIVELTDPRQILNALEMHHKTRLGGHCGIQRMIATMKRIYSWPSMMKDIKEYVNACVTCKKTKVSRYTRAPLQITSVGEKAFDHVFIDYMGPVVASEAGHTYIFVAICDLTKYSVAAPTMGHTAAITADCFMKEIILKFGFPSMVTSDRGAEFLSEMFRELNKRLEIKQISTTPYHPCANIVERQNRNLNQYLRAYVDLKPQIWAPMLPYATFAYNITVQSSTGFSPFHLLYGREITLPDAITQKKPIYNYDNYVDVLLRELHDAWALAGEKLHSVKLKNKEYYDRKLYDPELKVGDYVYLVNEVKKHKWDSPKHGPYEIKQIPSEQYVIVDVDGNEKKIHKNKTSKSRACFEEIQPTEQKIINTICTFY